MSSVSASQAKGKVGKNYAAGCTGLVCELLGKPQKATPNWTRGDAVDEDDLSSGDVIGWGGSGSQGHVAVYVGEAGCKFVDVPGPNKPAGNSTAMETNSSTGCPIDHLISQINISSSFTSNILQLQNISFNLQQYFKKINKTFLVRFILKQNSLKNKNNISFRILSQNFEQQDRLLRLNLMMDRDLFLYALSGGIAGITVDVTYYPLETIKTRIMGSSKKQNLMKNAQSISKFKGFSCQLIVSFPYSFAFFYVYEIVRRTLPRGYWSDFTAAVAGQAFSNIFRNPLEVVKQQLMVGRESKIRESLRNIYSMKGLRGFYTGYAPTLLRDISFSAIQMPLFEHLKPLIGGALGLHQEDPKICSISGSTSAFISAFLTCPFDVIKTRHQTMRMTEENVSISKVVKDILLEEGYRGLWKGVSIRCLILTIGGLFYFYSFGKAKNLLQVVHT